jgi:hypothetical protein
MSEKTKRVILFLIFYALIFWIGFRSGEIYNRMRKAVFEKVQIPEPFSEKVRLFYIIEERGRGNSSYLNYDIGMRTHPIMQYFFNSRMRPFLKKGKVWIYTARGERIF